MSNLKIRKNGQMDRVFQKDEVKNYILKNGIRYVSFDLFDTLVFRSIHKSSDVYTLIHRRYDDENGKSKYDLQQKRLDGEIKARENSKTDDVTIDDIYHCVDLPNSIKGKIKKLECELEIELSVPNKEVIGFIKDIRELGTTILITSDMYLDRDTIASILKKHEIEYDYLFLSGEVGLRKDTGKLFQYVLSELSINSKDIIHIGDNKKADLDNPEQIGIRAYRYVCCNPEIENYFISTNSGYLYKRRGIARRIYDRLYKSVLKKNTLYDSIYSNCLTGHIDAVCKSEQSNSVRLGYGVIGPLMVALCQWIHKQKKAENLDQLWFVAREGYLIEKVYRTLYPEDSEIIKYVRYNKNVCRLPFALSAKSVEEKKAILPSLTTITVDNMLLLFGVNDTEKILREIKDKTGYESNSRIIVNELNNDKNLLLWSILVRSVEETGLEQMNMLIAHIHNSVGQRDLSKVRVGLINNSINGNGQYLLEKILESKDDNSIEFCGLQFIDSNTCKDKGIKYHAWLVEFGDRFYVNVFRRTLNVLERLLFENCGTAIGLKCRRKDIMIYCEERKLENRNDEVLLPIQEAAVKFAEFFRKYNSCDITKDALAIYFQLINYPTIKDAKIIGNIAYDEVGDSGTLIKKDDSKTIMRLLKNARREVWPNGYLSVNNGNKLLKDLFVLRDRMG